MVTDIVSWMYLIGCLAFAYGAAIFIFEAVRTQSMSWIFRYIMLLFVGGTIAWSADVYARHLRFENIALYYEFMDSFIWHVRRVPIILSLLFIDVHATLRILLRRRNESNNLQEDKS